MQLRDKDGTMFSTRIRATAGVYSNFQGLSGQRLDILPRIGLASLGGRVNSNGPVYSDCESERSRFRAGPGNWGVSACLD